MSDLFSSLRDPEQLPSPPVEEVRRRGDSLRRRRQALQAGGVAALVAVVALAAAGVSGGLVDRSSEVPPATQPPAPSAPPSPSDRITAIPASFDIAQGLEDGGSEDRLDVGTQVRWIADETACDADHSPADEQTDHVAALLTVPGHTTGRDLRVFASDATAARVAADFVGWFRDCPTFSLDGGASETTNRVVDGEPAGSSWVVTQTYTSGGQPQVGQNILLVEVVGNAVLVVKDYGEGPGATDEPQLRRQVSALRTATQPMLDELACTFGNAGGC